MIPPLHSRLHALWVHGIIRERAGGDYARLERDGLCVGYSAGQGKADYFITAEGEAKAQEIFK